ncbi:DUF6077 domain-containing protein [uncultured Pseudokineococcus sp.]|uniref:DUF6077 domain-containing protein n=1 Tax=uncultured Pseudokineococcus sp. TaxID=1642928 RepID=UPI002612E4FE|nr:DUF6077 domain-containing protein [uncultured Pseudokineococcus sp.]
MVQAAQAAGTAPAAAPVEPVGPATPAATGCLERGVGRVLDAAVLLLATWTPVYHLCLLLRWGVGAAVALEVLALAGVAVALRLTRSRRSGRTVPAPGAATATVTVGPGSSGGPVAGADERPPGRRRARGRAPALVVALALAEAVLLAVRAPWPLVAALWLAAAAAGTATAVRALRRATRSGDEPAGAVARPGRSGVVVALVWAAALAVLAGATRWPNPDDLYYVNLSQWTAERGTFPLRDTIFSDEVFPMTSFPPVASYDGLLGTLAHLLGVPAASVAYLVVPSVATALSVLALWRLLRAWRTPLVAVALSLALVFLLWDGGPGYAAPGNLFLIRLWQGKVVLLCLLVPLLLVALLRHAERALATGRSARRDLAALAAGGTAAVGLSTTGIFLVPVLALGGVAPLLVARRWRAAATGFVVASAYPLAAGAVTLAVGGRSADDFAERRLFRFDPSWFGHEIFRDGVYGLVGVAAVLLGALLVPSRAARVTTGALALVVGVTFVPGVTQLAYDLVGLGPTLWRISWAVTVAALVGVLGARLAAGGRRRRLLLPAGVAAALVAAGLPIWSPANGVSLDWPPRYERGLGSVVVAEDVIARAAPGDTVLLPEQDAITLTVLTTRVKTVAPRDYFLDQLRDVPGFRYEQRLLLVRFANGEVVFAPDDEVVAALDDLDVDQVCLLFPEEGEPPYRTTRVVERAQLLLGAGFTPTQRVGRTSCYAR